MISTQTVKSSVNKSFMNKVPGKQAIANKGWLKANKWLLFRRISQLSILLVFLLGPLMGVWIVKGNMSSSLILNVLPLADPFVFMQTLFAGHTEINTLIFGAFIVGVFYFLIGGRVYCSWVCPVNIVTDSADWLRRKLNLKSSFNISRTSRYALLASVLLISAISGALVWELINPVTMLQRELVFAMGLSWMVVTAIFILDAFVSKRAWCGHLCPMGAFYSLIACFSLLKVNAAKRENCNDCMDCFVVCPEPQVIKPALKGSAESSPVIASGNCTNCARCIDVCAQDVFSISHRFTS